MVRSSNLSTGRQSLGPVVQARHRGLANAIFLDGYVSTKKRFDTPVPFDTTGWSTPTDETRRRLEVFDLSSNDGKNLFENSNKGKGTR